MSSNIRDHYPHLQLLAQPKNNKKLIHALLANPKVVSCICEIIHNALCGNINYTDAEKNCLRKFRNVMYKLQRKKMSTNIKRRLILQHGSGFLAPLIGPAIAVLSSLFT